MANIIGLDKPGKRTGVMNEPKPYEGYRNGRGMPSAREPFYEYTEEGRKRHETAFGKNQEWYEKRDAETAICSDQTCIYSSIRKSNGCVMFSSIADCHKKRFE